MTFSRRAFLISRSMNSRPSCTELPNSSSLIHWRILLRARAVFTNASQSREGRCRASVRISTVSPLASSRVIGAMRPFTRAPTQCTPTSVCTAKAK
ncbi:MAG TPA: hypothetical protein VFT45_04745, partial [Longimicrobium sp.]|nr:hypothetical protein [Longimicrobium sp.]